MPRPSVKMVPCRKCRLQCEGVAQGEEVLASQATRVINAVARNFLARCPEHGEFAWQDPAGHHTTIQKKALKRTFAIDERAELRKRLGDDERRRFNDALAGRLWPTDEEVAEWKRLCVEG